MNRLLVLALVAACRHPSHGSTDANGGGGDDGNNGGGDGNGGGGGDGSGSSGGDGGIVTGCTQPRTPTQVMTRSSVSDLNFQTIFSAGGQVFATPPLGGTTTWLHWTGSAWNEETIPWPSGLSGSPSLDQVVQLSSGKALIRSRSSLVTFDGTAFSAPIATPPTANTTWAYAEGPDGSYHVFHDKAESVSKPDGTWYPDAPLPLGQLDDPKAATVMADGRVVVMFLDVWFTDSDPSHVHVMSRVPGHNWTTPQDITPTWAVHAAHGLAYAPPGGGVVIGADDPMGVVWRSPDGVTFGDFESLGLLFLGSVAGPCLDSLVATVGYQTRYDLMKLDGNSWTTLDTQSLSYIDNAGAAMTSDGRTFWALGETYRAEYRATP